MKLLQRRRVTIKGVTSCSSPEELGEVLWGLLGSPVTHELFDASLERATSFSTFQTSRLYYPWNALVALAPDLTSLQRCLAAAPQGFVPLLDESCSPAQVFGASEAWRTAAVLGHLFSTAKDPSLISTTWVRAVDKMALSQLHALILANASMALLCDTLADALFDATPAMSWKQLCDLVLVWAQHPAGDITWTRALIEELSLLGKPDVQNSTVRASCVQIWRSLICDPAALEHVRTLRNAGAVGTIGELMTAAAALSF